MASFFVALLTGITWMGLTADFGLGALAVGSLLGLGLWRLQRSAAGRRFALVPALRLAAIGSRLFAVFLWELVVANVGQLRIVLAPRIDIRPGWILYRSALQTPAARALLGAMISLTPGSLTYEELADEDGHWTISLHILDLQDEEALIEHIRSRFEAPLLAMELL
jgi:multicomponent Na+:H+ antiporter subunit E